MTSVLSKNRRERTQLPCVYARSAHELCDYYCVLQCEARHEVISHQEDPARDRSLTAEAATDGRSKNIMVSSLLDSHNSLLFEGSFELYLERYSTAAIIL